MASRANKYASLNFNDIYEKKITNPTHKNHHHPSSSSPSPSSLSSPIKTILSNSRIHGNMLVLSRPSPKPISQTPLPSPQTPQPQSPPPPTHHNQPPPSRPDQTRFEPDAISLRPLGRTGLGPSLAPSPLTLPKPDKEFSPSLLPSPKPDRFVPPHLRPGFTGREEKPEPEVQKQQGVRSREFGGHRQGQLGSLNRYEEDGRPKSGGGYERMRIVGDSDLVLVNRPGSSGTRPSSSG
ncbi:hypothetical protein U1Q18_001667 [Sarracenia purpurea var. burkii]